MNPLTRHTGQVVAMAWSKERPDKPNWYWYRDPLQPSFGAEIYLVDNECGPDTPLVVDGIPLDEFTGEWCGPLPLPSEGPAQGEREK